MKKNRYIFISAIILALVALVLLLTQTKTTYKSFKNDFAVDDTSAITKIFMTDKNNNSLKLTRVDQGRWVVNDKYPAQKQMINMLLATMSGLEIKEIVAKAAHNTIIKDMAIYSVKVEIYQMAFRINLFNWITMFPHEKMTKVYYVGGATPNNRGSYILMEDSEEPYVVYLPGLRGFVTPRYSPIEKYWRDFTIFNRSLPEITSVKMEFPSNQEDSYEVTNEIPGKVVLTSLIDNKKITDFDTIKVLTFLSGFRSLNFEALLNDMDPLRKDSILSSTPFIIITVNDTSGTSKSIKVFHKKNTAGITDSENNPLPYDPDRLYALVNEGKDFTIIQYFSFDKVLRPKFFFLKDISIKRKD